MNSPMIAVAFEVNGYDPFTEEDAEKIRDQVYDTLQLDGYEYDDVEVTLVPPRDHKRWTEAERHVLRQAVAEAAIEGAYHDDWHRIYGPLNAVADKLGRSFDKVRRYALYLKLLKEQARSVTRHVYQPASRFRDLVRPGIWE